MSLVDFLGVELQLSDNYNALNYGCSPHLLTIRERISVGQSGGPVSAELLRDLFGHAKEAIGQSIESEDGALTHFEVFSLFSSENYYMLVDSSIEKKTAIMHARWNKQSLFCNCFLESMVILLLVQIISWIYGVAAVLFFHLFLVSSLIFMYTMAKLFHTKIYLPI